MIYLEINTHTGESRLHTEGSLKKRLVAIRCSTTQVAAAVKGDPLETQHAVFRQSSADVGHPWARSNGAWGMDPQSIVEVNERREENRR